MTATHLTAPARFIEVDGDRFAYRRWGKPSGVPLAGHGAQFQYPDRFLKHAIQFLEE
jgi:hypothetical protein